MGEPLPEERPGFEGFGVREARQSVTLSYHGVTQLLTHAPSRALDFVPGEMLPCGDLGTLRVVEVVRHDRIARDGALERYWVLKVEAI